MNYNDYKKSLPKRTRLYIKWLRLRDKLLLPFYKYIHCTHSATVGELGADTAYCLLCHKTVKEI